MNRLIQSHLNDSFTNQKDLVVKFHYLNDLNFSLFHHTNLSSSEDLEYTAQVVWITFMILLLCPIWRSKPQSIHLFYFPQKKETKSYKFEMTWGWVKEISIIYGLTIPTLSKPDFKSPSVQFIQWWHPRIPCRPVWYMEKKCTHPSLIKENEKPNNTHYLLWFCWKDSVDEQ